MFKKKVVTDKKKETPKKPAGAKPHTYHRHSARVKQRAFELFMELDKFELRRMHTQLEIAKILQKEFKDDPKEDVSRLTRGLISFWISHYGWEGNYVAAVEKAKAMANADITTNEAFKGIADSMKVNTTSVDKLMRIIDSKVAIGHHIDKLAPIVSTAIVEMFMLNQEHFKNLMARRKNGWTYDCDKYGTRKQLFDMWMAGTTKLLDVYALTPPKRSTTHAKVTTTEDGQEIDIDSTSAGGVNLSEDNYELILKLFGIERSKGGFGHALTGPDNADFPSSAGAAGPIKNSEG